MRQGADRVVDCCWILEAELEEALDCVKRVELGEGMREDCGEMLHVLDSRVSHHEKDDHNTLVGGSHVEEVIWM